MSKVTQNQLKNFGVILYPGFQALDVFGPLDALNILSSQFPINLYVIAQSLDPVSTKIPTNQPGYSTLSDCGQSVVPTHTFENAPDLDVLIVPGGLGNRADSIITSIDFIRNTYPSLKHVLTVCTGSWLAARAGILDGKRATSNKRHFKEATKLGNNVQWIARARWVVDGNVWTASGVSAGIDAMLAFIEEHFNSEVAQDIADVMEYEWHQDSSRDPFAEKNGL